MSAVYRFVNREFFEKLRADSFDSGRDTEHRLQIWVSKLYSLVLDALKDPRTKSSIERFIQKTCREISMAALEADIIPEKFPLSVDELIEIISKAVHRVVKEKIEEYVSKGLVEPTTDSVARFAKIKTLEVLGTCFESSLIRLGVVV
jgi:uncharacterized membrane-anchored protein YjiN (DUF445 family)